MIIILAVFSDNVLITATEKRNYSRAYILMKREGE